MIIIKHEKLRSGDIPGEINVEQCIKKKKKEK